MLKLISPHAPPPDLIPVVVPGGDLSLLFGATGTGKTALYTEWIARILDGRTILGLEVQPPPKIGIIFTDRRWHVARHWLDVNGITDRVTTYCLKDDMGFAWAKLRSTANHQKLFEEALDKLGDLPAGSLIIPDALATYLGTKLNDYPSTAAAIGPIAQICAKRRITVIGINHTGKPKTNKLDQYIRPQDRILGSTALGAYTNTQFYIVSPEETGRAWFTIGYSTHNAPGKAYKFRKDNRGIFTPWHTTGNIEDSLDVERPTITDDMELILEMVPTDEPGVSTSVLLQRMRQEHRISGRSTHRRLKEMETLGLIKKTERGVWVKCQVEAGQDS